METIVLGIGYFFIFSVIIAILMVVIYKLRTLYYFYIKKKVRVDPMICLFCGTTEEIWRDRDEDDKFSDIVW